MEATDAAPKPSRLRGALQGALRKAKAADQINREIEEELMMPINLHITIPPTIPCIKAAFHRDHDLPVPPALFLHPSLPMNRKELLDAAVKALDQSVSVSCYVDPWTHKTYQFQSQLHYCNVLNRLFQSIAKDEIPWSRLHEMLSEGRPVERQLALSRLSCIQQWEGVPAKWAGEIWHALFELLLKEDNPGNVKPMVLYCAMRLSGRSSVQRGMADGLQVTFPHWIPEMDLSSSSSRRAAFLICFYYYLRAIRPSDDLLRISYIPFSSYVHAEPDTTLRCFGLSLMALLLSRSSTAALKEVYRDKLTEKLLVKDTPGRQRDDEVSMRSTAVLAMTIHLLRLHNEASRATMGIPVHVLTQYFEYMLGLFTACGLLKSKKPAEKEGKRKVGVSPSRAEYSIILSALHMLRVWLGYTSSQGEVGQLLLQHGEEIALVLNRASGLGIPMCTILSAECTGSFNKLIGIVLNAVPPDAANLSVTTACTQQHPSAQHTHSITHS